MNLYSNNITLRFPVAQPRFRFRSFWRGIDGIDTNDTSRLERSFHIIIIWYAFTPALVRVQLTHTRLLSQLHSSIIWEVSHSPRIALYSTTVHVLVRPTIVHFADDDEVNPMYS